MAIRNMRAVIREKNMSLSEIACQTGIQQSVLQLIMMGAYVPDLHFRRLIAGALGEPTDNELFEISGKVPKAPLG